MAPLHKICVWTQIRKIKRNLIFNQSESRINDLRLIFLICVQTQILCNRAYVAYHLTRHKLFWIQTNSKIIQMILVNLKHNKNRWGGVAKNAESSSVKIEKIVTLIFEGLLRRFWCLFMFLTCKQKWLNIGLNTCIHLEVCVITTWLTIFRILT